MAREKEDTIASICQLIGQRVENLFITRQLWCSAAALVVLNQGLGGELTTEQAIRLTSGLGEGLGGSGCACGAVTGSVLALGLFLGSEHYAPIGNKTTTHATHMLHDRFKTEFASTCCRVLINYMQRGSREHYQQCAQRTSRSAQWAAELILDQRPDLINQVDWDYLNQKEGRLSARLKNAANMLKG